jgi:hypothetical protein
MKTAISPRAAFAHVPSHEQTLLTNNSRPALWAASAVNYCFDCLVKDDGRRCQHKIKRCSDKEAYREYRRKFK